jgi:N-acetylneuraminic acid mutarotase
VTDRRQRDSGNPERNRARWSLHCWFLTTHARILISTFSNSKCGHGYGRALEEPVMLHAQYVHNLLTDRLARAQVAMVACSLLAGAPPGRATAQQGEWQTVASMRNARSAHNVVATADGIYALAGTGAGSKPVLEVERFDGTQWVTETTLPGSGLNAPSSVVLGGRIYLIGGFNTTTNIPTAQVMAYDLAKRTWSEVAPLPSPRGGHAAVVVDGRIHVLGGGNSQSTLADHTVYDPGTNTWAVRAPLPRAKGSPAAVVVAGRIWAIGGRSGFSDFGEVDVYDPRTNAWTTGPAIERRGTHGAVVYRGAIWVIGGESQAKGASLSSVLRLQPGGAWEAAGDMPTARTYARAVVFRDAIYVVGGSPMAGSSHSSTGGAVVERFSIKP